MNIKKMSYNSFHAFSYMFPQENKKLPPSPMNALCLLPLPYKIKLQGGGQRSVILYISARLSVPDMQDYLIPLKTKHLEFTQNS